MMVTFVSQCEKKSLKKTRRILDTFADRIGDNVWQTIITKEGLIAVKSLLKRSASKNTAVACHWMRSRRRTDLMWIVGNRNQFNEEGKVPVNRTNTPITKEIIMINENKNELYANTYKQSLADHLFAVGYLAQRLFSNIVKNKEKKNLEKTAFLGGCFHDLGKVDPLFQSWAKKGKTKDLQNDGQHIETKFTFDKHPRHNEISAIFLAIFEEQLSSLNNAQKEALLHVVYWHHAKPFRKTDDFNNMFKAYEYLNKNLTPETLKKTLADCVDLLGKVKKLAENYGESDSVTEPLSWSISDLSKKLEQFEYRYNKVFSDFKYYSVNDDFETLRQKIDRNAQNNLLRSCVISADRIISKLSKSDLTEYIQEKRLDELVELAFNDESQLLAQLDRLSTIFPASERSTIQNEIADQLNIQKGIPVLSGPAGCGKTKIALEWARLQKASKIIWVCPRVQVCQGVFQELIETYLPDAKIEIFTGEFKYTNEWGRETKEDDYFSADVVVTTIDQIFGSIVTHSKVDSLLSFMDAHIVFDEFHEYIPMPIFNLLFAELIANKNMRSSNDKRVLLVSATPHYFYLKHILGFHESSIIEMSSFNQSQYKLNFIEYDENVLESNPFYKTYNEPIFIISNTALTAQLSFIYQQKNEDNILFHSKFKKSDKMSLFDEVYDSFKKEGTKAYKVLRSGPIVQASLNITTDKMLTEMTSPENMLQRLGRLDRFGENKEINILSIAITDNVKRGKCQGSLAYFLNKLNSLQSTKHWYDFLQEKIDEDVFSLTQMYQLYKSFYSSAQGVTAVKQDVENAIKESIKMLNDKVSEPRTVTKNKTKETKIKISQHSLRGDSRFIQLAVVNLNDYHHPVYENHYAYERPLDDFGSYDNLTESLSKINNADIISYLAQKHGRIDPAHPISGVPDKKNTIRRKLLENYSRDPDYPLYLSYTPADLDEKLGGEQDRNPYAVYYAVCDKQAIGTIELSKVNEILNSQVQGEQK